MKKVYFFFFIAITLFETSPAQKIVYILHPLVGDTIDQSEKKKYYLFSEIADSVYQSGFIYQEKDKKFLDVVLADKSSYTFSVNDSLLEQYFLRIKKLNAFYLERAKHDSLGGTENYRGPMSKNDGSSQLDPIITPAMRLQISKSTRINNRIKDDELRMELYKKGLGIDLINLDW